MQAWKMSGTDFYVLFLRAKGQEISEGNCGVSQTSKNQYFFVQNFCPQASKKLSNQKIKALHLMLNSPN